MPRELHAGHVRATQGVSPGTQVFWGMFHLGSLEETYLLSWLVSCFCLAVVIVLV